VLTLRGHPVVHAGDWHGTLGHAHAIRINRETGFYEGGADPRGGRLRSRLLTGSGY